MAPTRLLSRNFLLILYLGNSTLVSSRQSEAPRDLALGLGQGALRDCFSLAASEHVSSLRSE